MYKVMAACKICEQELAVYNHGGVYCRNCQNKVSVGDGQGGIQEPGNTSYGRRKFGNILRKKSSGSLKSLSPSNMLSLSSISSREELPSGKRALLCGVTYQKEKFKLRGTLQDVKNMRDLLVEQFSFEPASILILAGNGISGIINFQCNLISEKKYVPCRGRAIQGTNQEEYTGGIQVADEELAARGLPCVLLLRTWTETT